MVVKVVIVLDPVLHWLINWCRMHAPDYIEHAEVARGEIANVWKKNFGYSKYYSVTEIAVGLSSFDTVIHNYGKSFLYVWSKHSNDLVKLLPWVSPSAFL